MDDYDAESSDVFIVFRTYTISSVGNFVSFPDISVEIDTNPISFFLFLQWFEISIFVTPYPFVFL